MGIGAGDAVFVPSFTFAATAEVVALTGASPIFVDIMSNSFNMDPAHLELAIKGTKEKGELTPKAIIAVDLFGQIANYPALPWKPITTYMLALMTCTWKWAWISCLSYCLAVSLSILHSCATK